MFDWQLLSPVSVSVASRWVWTQSQTFQRTSKLRKTPPTKAFSSILTSQPNLVLPQIFRRKNNLFIIQRKLEEENDYKFIKRKRKSIHEARSRMKSWMSPLVWSRMTATLRHETSGLVFVCLAGGFEVSCRLQTKKKQGKVSFFSVLCEWNERCKCDSRRRLQLSPVIGASLILLLCSQ